MRGPHPALVTTLCTSALLLSGCVSSFVYQDLVHGGQELSARVTPYPVCIVAAETARGEEGAFLSRARLRFADGSEQEFAAALSDSRSLSLRNGVIACAVSRDTCAVVDTARLSGDRELGFRLTPAHSDDQIASDLRPLALLDGDEVLLFPAGQRRALADGTLDLGRPIASRIELDDRRSYAAPSSGIALFVLLVPVTAAIDLLLLPIEMPFIIIDLTGGRACGS